MPGITNWQSPNFHAYYPTATSYPSIVGEMIAASIGVVGFSWVRFIICLVIKLMMCVYVIFGWHKFVKKKAPYILYTKRFKELSKRRITIKLMVIYVKKPKNIWRS